jgi:ABC-type Fe3+ transport system permease subunit
MHRAYLLIAVPAILVGIAYVVLLRRMGFEIHSAPFLGTAAAAVAAIWLVRRHQKRKPRRHGNP